MDILNFLDENGQPLANIADKLKKEKLTELGGKVVHYTDMDLGTMEEWLKKTADAMKIAKQVIEKKTEPWENCANVKFPLIAGAAIQYAARAYAEIIKGHEVVKTQVIGNDPNGQKAAKGRHISRHMSYQLLDQMTEWEPQTDQMLHMQPVVGTVFKKSYYCTLRQRNVSELVKVGEGGLIFDNKNVKDIDTCRRVTHEIPMVPNDIKERINSGLFVEFEVDKYIPEGANGDDQIPHTILEQYRWDDLDEDGYEEPYIVTVHKESQTVLRVVARYDLSSIDMEDKDIIKIDPINFFTKYGFFPDPEGGYLDLGFGHMLYAINDAINTNLNQLLDAGTLANMQGGFVARGFRIKAQTFSLSPGEWKQIDVPAGDLKNSIFPVPYKEPSAVLFSLLGLLIETGKALASQTEVLQGEQPAANVPATTILALIEQGMKVYNAIYKRFYRSMKQELKKLARLNKIYLDEVEYFTVLDEDTAIAREDYEDANIDIIPVADPAASTEVQRMARAQALMQIVSHPLANQPYILGKYVDAIGENPKQALVDPSTIQQQPDVKLLELDEKINYNRVKLSLEEMQIRSQLEVNESIKILNIANAEAKEIGSQMQQYIEQAQKLNEAVTQVYGDFNTMLENAKKAKETENEDNESGVSGMETAPGDGGISEILGGLEDLAGEAEQPQRDGRLNAESSGME